MPVSDLRAFRDQVRSARRSASRTQQQLAREIGLHPDVLSHKLNGASGAVLHSRDVTAIVRALAGWGGIGSREDAERLLELGSVPVGLVASMSWDQPPLSTLPLARSASEPPDPMWWVGEHVPNLRPQPLPEPVTSLVGRTDEVVAVAETLRRHRLVTLLGAGGTGKTRVALQVAKEAAGDFPDGVAFVDLAPLTSPETITDAVLRSLGLAPEIGGVTEEQLFRALRPVRVLLVLDNMEHLLAGAALLSRLLAAAPELSLLVTSRVVLQLYGEQQIRIRPLELPAEGSVAPPTAVRANDAVELFCQRARAVHPGFEPVGAELTTVAQICRVLGGLPLAIELAAARVRTFPPPALLERLESHLGWLRGGPPDLPRRQQSLIAALPWSEALLSPEQRRLFAHLGIFAGSFDAAGAAAVTDQLVQGAEFSRSSNDIERTRRLAGEALVICEQLDEPGAASRAHRLIGEVDLAAGEVDRAMLHFDRQLELAELTGDRKLIGDARNMLGQGYVRLGRLDDARTCLLASLSDFRVGGDMDVVGAVIGSLAELSYRAGDLDRSGELWAEGLRIHHRTRTFRGVAYGLEGCAMVEAARGRGRSALEFAAAAHRIRDAGGWVIPDPERRALMAAIAEPVGALSDDERQRAIADGRHRDLAAVIADAIATTSAGGVPALDGSDHRL